MKLFSKQGINKSQLEWKKSSNRHQTQDDTNDPLCPELLLMSWPTPSGRITGLEKPVTGLPSWTTHRSSASPVPSSFFLCLSHLSIDASIYLSSIIIIFFAHYSRLWPWRPDDHISGNQGHEPSFWLIPDQSVLTSRLQKPSHSLWLFSEWPNLGAFPGLWGSSRIWAKGVPKQGQTWTAFEDSRPLGCYKDSREEWERNSQANWGTSLGD